MASSKSIGQHMDFTRDKDITGLQEVSYMARHEETKGHLGTFEAIETFHLQQKALRRANFALLVSLVTVICISCAFFMHVQTLHKELFVIKDAVAKCSQFVADLDNDDFDLETQEYDLPTENDPEGQLNSGQDFEDLITPEHGLDWEKENAVQHRVKRSAGELKDLANGDGVENSTPEQQKPVPRKVRFSPGKVMRKLENLEKLVKRVKRSSRNKRARRNIAVQLHGDASSEFHRESLDEKEVKTLSDGGKLTRTGYVAPRDDVIKMWRKEDWVPNKSFVYSSSGGTLTVKQKGIYFIYAQLLFFNSNHRNGYAIMRKRGSQSPEPLTKCLTSLSHTHTSGANRYQTCTTVVIAQLEEGDEIFVIALRQNMTIILDKMRSHWGLVQLYGDP